MKHRKSGTYPQEPMIDAASSSQIHTRLPPNATGDAHVILEVTDDGDPPLTSYWRAVIEVGSPARAKSGSSTR